MNERMPYYGVTELSPDEAAAISGGFVWVVVATILGITAAIANWVYDSSQQH
ncbi:hypothetical protein O7A70_30485 [Mesorhizobium sp. Cs1299R1N1]|uniref:hypothetical protein n=1 Tax=Mesorhizobium sp. Cs1299R1N1 TaxID=3015172 RepID=UPI00301DEAE5